MAILESMFIKFAAGGPIDWDGQAISHILGVLHIHVYKGYLQQFRS